MLDALAAAGWRNYSLFLAPDGLLIGYFETDSLEAALAGMAGTAVNERWQASMAEFFEGTEGRAADEAFEVLPEVFNLDDQLAHHAEPNEKECPAMTTFADITDRLEGLAIEVPSWAYGNSGTRFKVFGSTGTPRTVQEKLADAAKVHEFTGLAPDGRAPHPVGPRRRLRRASLVRRGSRDRARHDQQQHVPGRRLQARQPDQRRSRASGRRRSSTTSTASR